MLTAREESYEQALVKLERLLLELRDLNAELVKTLEWYADESNYETGQDWPDILIDGGAGARRTVAKAREK